MLTKARLLSLFIATTLVAFGSTVTLTGPTLPIIGNPLDFKAFSVSITQPTSGNTWLVNIQTNYPGSLPNPGDPSIIPPAPYSNGLLYTMSDFLIQWQGNDYGLALTDHDGLTHGNLYQVNGYFTSLDVMGAGVTPRPSIPVLLLPPGTLIGTGTMSVAKTGDGVNTALYTITDRFTAPSNFLSTDVFQIIYSSYVCANGVIMGPSVPEPSTFALSLPALLVFGYFGRRIRARKSQWNKGVTSAGC
jgi:hypothetical protein